MDQSTERKGIKRRTLVAGTAWAVPAVTVASAAPAMAASGPEPTVVFDGACKYPGNSCSSANKGYGMVFTVTNDSGKTIYLCAPEILNSTAVDNQGNPIDFTYTGVECISVAAHTKTQVKFYFTGSADSGNQVFTFDIRIQWGHNCLCSDDPDHHAPIFKQGLQVTGTPPNGPICACN